MKYKVLLLLTILSLLSFNTNAQRGIRIGYIDTEYILQNVPEFQQASLQLDKKVQQWKVEVEKRLNAVELKKKELDNERVLLTKELYEERLEDIAFEEAEILDYQQKRFGPEGDLMIQKKQLIQPVQDQIFAAVQEIAESKKFDFIFDKSADVVMLYSAERYDISEQVLRSITRTSRRTQAKNKKERKAAEDEDIVPEIDEELETKQAERQKALDEKKADREAQLEERRRKQQELRDAKKKEAEARRAKILEDREKARQAKLDARNGKTTTEKTSDSIAKVTDSSSARKDSSAVKKEPSKAAKALEEAKKTRAQLLEEKKQQKAKDREARKKALEERRRKIDSIRKARAKKPVEKDTTKTGN